LNELGETVVIQRCLKGDREAFGMLVEKYQTLIFGTAYLMTHDRPMAEDAVQESLIKMWRYLPSLKHPDRFKAWMLKIVVSQVKQQGRKKKSLVTLEHITEPATDPDEIDCMLIQNEMHRELAQAIGGLSTEQREVVVLRYFSGLTIPEIAAATGWREGTVKSRLSRTLDRLSEVLRTDENRGGKGVMP
jgi:RNA polymerase sigma-70 factor (ECF subfamily)